MTVEVGPNDSTVEVKDGDPNHTKSYDVEPGKTANIPIPGVPAGTVLLIKVGRGARARMIWVEVVSTFR
ncbi:MAG: hypothetical protein JNK49_12280 [Planctomycetes bacterium]|nr:hypothetical protein [Planctomycetota bacterium]